MAYDGAGTFNRLFDWTDDRDGGIKIRADRMDQEMDGFATGLTTAVTKDGQTNPTANLPMAGFRHTGVGDASARNHYVAVGQIQDGALAHGTAAGTADALTLNITPSITAYVSGMTFTFKAAGTNTGATTLNVDAVGAKAIRKTVGTADAALDAGDIQDNGIYTVTYDEDANSAAGAWILHNPSSLFLTTRGDLIRRGASAPERVALGTSGQVLTSDGTDAVWAGPDVEVIASGSASSVAALDFTDLSTDYRAYVLVFHDLVAATDAVTLMVRTSADNGSTFDSGASDYHHGRIVGGSGGSAGATGSTATNAIHITNNISNAVARSMSGVLHIIDPAAVEFTRVVFDGYHVNSSAATVRVAAGGQRESAAAADAVRLLFSSGNISSITYTLYGLRAS